MAFTSAAAFLERAADVELRSLQGGRESEGDAGERRETEREGKHAVVDVNLVDARCAFREYRNQRIGQPNAEEQTGDAADGGEEQAFREHLPNDSCAARPHGRTDRDFFLSRRAARE